MLITDPKTIDTYYRALLDRKPQFTGVFFVGVKTTGVFCIATCRARKPKRENVVFYSTLKDALNEGFRPCKVCRPMENAEKTPPQVQAAIELLREYPKEKISDARLSLHQISPIVVRRWFKKHYGITFHAYQRMLRINNAFLELKGGKDATGTAFDSGYESLSGFGYTYKKLIGKSPKNSMPSAVILIYRLATPLGPMFACATEGGLCLLEFVDRRMLETEFKDLQKSLNARIIAGKNRHIKQAEKEISEYFNGQRKTFDIQLLTPGTEFQNSVWRALLEIPYGQTSTYQQQAAHIRRSTAVRAVARANGANRIAIIVPCHRVMGKDGQLTGYGGGIARKRWLIEHERKNSAGNRNSENDKR